MPKAKKLFLALSVLAVLALGALAAPTTALAQGGLAVVDTRKAVMECARGKRAFVELQKKGQKLESEINSLRQELENLRKDLENSAMLLKPEAKLAKERDFERKVRLFNDRQRDAQQEMAESERDAINPIMRDMNKVIQEIGVKNNYAVILPVGATAYYPKSADITAQVIAAFDKMNP